ncbi:MAG: hypothetical protein QW728_07485, partial [Thermoplasmata archaeon]
FVNWTDVNGNPPPSCGNIPFINNEWNGGPVNLSDISAADIWISRYESSGKPVDTDTKADWIPIPEMGECIGVLAGVVVPAVSMLLRIFRRNRKDINPREKISISRKILGRGC